MLLEHLRSSRRGSGSVWRGAAELRARAAPWAEAQWAEAPWAEAPWGRGSVGQRLSGQRLRSRRLPAEPPQCPAPAPRPSPTSALFRAEFVSIIELPATYLKSLTRPLEERCIARSKSFELFFSSQNSEQQAIVCLNLVMCSDRLPCFLFFSRDRNLVSSPIG